MQHQQRPTPCGNSTQSRSIKAPCNMTQHHYASGQRRTTTEANCNEMRQLRLLIFTLASMLLHCLPTPAPAVGIVNPDPEQSANVVIVMEKPVELGPRTWNAGVQCLDEFTKIYFQRREHLTRSYNMVLTSAVNMSTPAAQIQDGYLKLLNEAVGLKPPAQHELFQLRIVSDANRYQRVQFGKRALLFADFYILIVDSVERLKNLMEKHVSRMSSWNPGALFLVLYNNVDVRDQREEIAKDIFGELLYNYYVHRIGMLYATDDTQYTFLVMDYYNKVACRTLRLRRIGECRDGQPYPDSDAVNLAMNIYFDNVSLDNCTFYMCASIAEPFVEEDCVTGVELRLVALIKNRLGFNINQTCESESRGVFDNNTDTWTGLLSKVVNRECDFILGGFYPDNDVIGKFWSSDCYLSDSYTWYVKLADRRPAWKSLISIFRTETWICFLVMLLITWFFWSLFVNALPESRASKEISLTGINTLAVSICVSVNERPVCHASRVFFFSLALYGLNVVSTYTSKLIAVFTHPGYLHQIDTLNEVVEAGIPFGGWEECRDWFENDDDMWIFEQYNDSSMFDPEPFNLEAVRLGERVILSSRMFILQNNISDNIFAFPRNVFSSPMQMIMKAGFPFLSSFNWYIRNMRDAGFFEKIDRDFVYNNTYLNRIAKMRPAFENDVIVLTTDHLQGPFAILMVGTCSSTFFFICELLVYWIFGPFLQRRRQGSEQTKKPKKAQTLSKINKNTYSKHERKQKLRSNNSKLTKLKHKIIKPEAGDDIQMFNVNAMHSLRFTPIKRRHIVIK